MQTETAALDNLHTLETLFKKGHKSNLLGMALDKLVALEFSNTKRELREIETRLSEFEEKYAMSSESFEKKFHAGSTDDSADAMEWISFIDMRKAIFQKIRLLREKSE